MAPDISFGQYLRQKREEKQITMRRLCERIDLSPAYLSDIENDRRYPMEGSKLILLARALNLSPEEEEEMFDLAARTRDEVSADLKDYIMGEREVRVALRMARDAHLSKEDWLTITEQIREIPKRE